MRILKLSDNVSLKQYQEKYMLFDNINGNIYKLNRLSYEILLLCDGKNTDEDIINNIINNFAVSTEKAAKDFDDIINTLLDKQYVLNVI
ncbi:MAG: PqqD family protein [Deltaproteobacteria bacterium]|nr:PqqD family protein [Deltaproteobacteria bacterium]